MIRPRFVFWGAMLGVLLGLFVGVARADAQAPVTIAVGLVAGTDDALSGRDSGDYDSVDGFAVVFGKGHLSADDPLVTGLRFLDLDVPAGAVVTDARLTVTGAFGDGDFTVRLRVRNEASTAPATFGAGAMPDDRTPGEALSELWSIDLDAWSDNDHESPNLANVVQEAVDRPGWAGDLVLLVEDDGGDDWIGANAISWETDPVTAPRLSITYTLPVEGGGGCGDPCVVQLDAGTETFVVVLGALVVFFLSAHVVGSWRRG